eukprot:TRINITY_DN58186_c0_g1_i1.p1 TRINITY_DN58186_c0_g1~~TRINITY_DN58186_c0_g1_i1.p1  ORF type:complete len:342 (+),score=44.85 TRINITY_DN58186_c0_g1_i1:63-1088(+)
MTGHGAIDTLTPAHVRRILRHLELQALCAARCTSRALQSPATASVWSMLCGRLRTSDDWAVRKRALSVFARLAKRQCDRPTGEDYPAFWEEAPNVATAVGDVDGQVRELAVQTLDVVVHTGANKVVEILASLLAHDDHFVRIAAAAALAVTAMRGNAESALATATASLRQSPMDCVRAAAASALGQSMSACTSCCGKQVQADALEALCRGCEDQFFNVRLACLQALVRGVPYDGPGVVAASAAVLGLSEDPVDGVRQAVATAIAKLDSRSTDAVAALVQLTKDESWAVRKAAVESLAVIRNPKDLTAAVALRARLGDTHSLVRRAAEESMSLSGVVTHRQR